MEVQENQTYERINSQVIDNIFAIKHVHVASHRPIVDCQVLTIVYTLRWTEDAQRVYAQTKNTVTRRKFDKNVMIIPDNDYLGNRTK